MEDGASVFGDRAEACDIKGYQIFNFHFCLLQLLEEVKSCGNFPRDLHEGCITEGRVGRAVRGDMYSVNNTAGILLCNQNELKAAKRQRRQFNWSPFPFHSREKLEIVDLWAKA